MNQPVRAAAIAAGCSPRQADVIATWVEAETLDDTAEQLGISNRAVLQHLRKARHRLGVPHNGTLVGLISNPRLYAKFAAAR